jgi:thiamine pyrophosphate-dependent acetolactate synthase large subunit-like protein
LRAGYVVTHVPDLNGSISLPETTGGRNIAEFWHRYGVKAVFFVPTILSRALAEMGNLPIKRGSLRWAFPASLGAKCAAPHRPVVCFTGDGGFWYHLEELETAVRCGIPAIVCINNNHSLNQEAPIFYEAYEGKPSHRQGEMWHFSKVDLAAVAENMVVLGIRVEKPYELRSALDRAISCNKPAVIDIQSDIEVLAPIAWDEKFERTPARR